MRRLACTHTPHAHQDGEVLMPGICSLARVPPSGPEGGGVPTLYRSHWAVLSESRYAMTIALYQDVLMCLLRAVCVGDL